ncbi:TIGR00341 family protein [Aerolutibacter daejeonensis]|uniref:TIGR00341 family protein n=1 Tax=Aerolutibacter daejeonensis TaxID=346181 RepID=UPI00068C04C7|nr:TIGR00341 family protein [Lysobacter daejeonensis]
MPDAKVWWRWLRQWRREHLKLDRFEVLQHVDEGGALAPRYAFMTVMSCGIATLGLLQNSAAVIIGAMLISPLMGPIIELGMSLATFDFRSLRAALRTLAVGVAIALVTSMVLVAVSPLQEATGEILARTEPTLFDLLVAVFSGLAGAYATVTRKGETIVGVAIATALMPPLAVVGFGVATGNMHVAGGAFFLFMTNLLAIALSVTIMARWYGFGREDSPEQTAWQAGLIIGTFLVLSVPLGLALRDIAARGLAERTIRTTLDEAARKAGGRISTLRVDRDGALLAVDALLVTPVHKPQLASALEDDLERQLGRPVRVELREVLTADDARLAREQASIAELRESVKRLQGAADQDRQARDARQALQAQVRERGVAWLGALEALDDGQQVRWQLDARAGLDLGRARALEAYLRGGAGEPAAANGIEVVPSLQALPGIAFDGDNTALSDAAQRELGLARWALQRWRVSNVQIATGGRDAALATTRAQAVAQWLGTHGVQAEIMHEAERPAGSVDLVLAALSPPAR